MTTEVAERWLDTKYYLQARDDEMLNPYLTDSFTKIVKDCTSVLELGCGSGWLSRIVPAEVRYLGIDYSPLAISTARERYQTRNHQFEQEDILAYETPATPFDLACEVTLIATLEHSILQVYNLIFDLLNNCATKCIYIVEDIRVIDLLLRYVIYHYEYARNWNINICNIRFGGIDENVVLGHLIINKGDKGRKALP